MKQFYQSPATPTASFFPAKNCLVWALVVFSFLKIQNLQAQCDPDAVSAGDDKYTCTPPMPVTLDGSVNGQYLSVQWTPPTGLAGANTLSPTATVLQTTTYVLTARIPNFNDNLIENGDFSGGNNAFDSDYSYSPGNLWPEGTYDILNNPQASHANFAPCQDHTGGGDMMCVNGAGVAGVNVWCQTVNVNPNTEYIFSAWVCSVISQSPAQLQFSINGNLLGGILAAPGGTCTWVNFYQIWNSGGASSANICIVNQNTALSGNDFALDDLSFYEICRPKDTVTVHVVNIKAQASPTTTIIPCNGANITLSGAGSTTGPNISYNWETADGNIVSGANTLNPVVNAPGEYTLTVTFDDGNIVCEKTATVLVSPNPLPLAAIVAPPPPLACATPQVTIVAAPNQQPGPFSYEWSTANGNIVGSNTNPNIIVNQPGTYTVTITQSQFGCTGTGTATVSSNGLPPTAVATGGLINCDNPTLTVSGAGSSTGTGINYAWGASAGGQINGSTTSQNATALTAGTYTITVTNTTNGCTTVDTAIVTANLVAPVVALAQPDPSILDCDTDTVSIVAGATPPTVNFAWTASNGGNIASGANTSTPQITAAGNFTVIVTNPANGCRDTATINVNSDFAAPTVSIAPPQFIDCQNPAINLTATAGGAATFGTPVWTTSGGGNIVSGGSTLTPSVNAGGQYTVTVVNSQNGCTASATATVQADTNAVKAIANAPDLLTCVVGQVAINSNGSSNGATINYSWSVVSPGGQINGGTTTPTTTVTAPGTYQLLVSNTANGCTGTDLVTVVEDKNTPNVMIALPEKIGCLQKTVVLHAENSSTGAGFSYAWSAAPGGNIFSDGNTLTPTVDAPGTYTLTITNSANGCTATGSTTVEIDASAPVAVVAAPLEINCVRASISLDATGSSVGQNFSPNWTNAAGGTQGITAGVTSLTPVVDKPGTYILLITNNLNQCTATAQVEIFENKTAPPADAGLPGTLTCLQETIDLKSAGANPTGNFQFAWTASAGGNFTAPTDAAQTACDQPGTYTLVVTDPANGCTASDTVVIGEDKEIPELSILPPDTLTCSAVQVQLTAICTATTGNVGFQWFTQTGNIISGGNSFGCVVSIAADYIAFSFNLVNGCRDTASVSVPQNADFPAVEAGVPQTLTCTKTTATLTGTADSGPGMYYLWSTQNGQILNGKTTLSPEIGAPGTYVLQVSNNLTGCISTDFVEIFENKTPPLADAGANDTLSCGISNLLLDGSGSSAGSQFSYLWTTPNGNLTGGQTTVAPTVAAPGTYILKVTDAANGCTATSTVEVLKDSNAPLASAGLPDTLTCVKKQTTLNGSASSGPNISFSWTATGGGQISGNPNSLTPTATAPGTYFLTVVNNLNACTTVASVVIAEDVTPPAAEAGLPATLNCELKNLKLNGTASANGNPFSVNWTTANGNISAGANTTSPTIDAAGTYVFSVKNLKNGCESSDAVTVGLDTVAPKLSIAAAQTLTCILKTVNLQGSVAPPLSNFSAAWTPVSPGAHLVSGQNSLTPTVDEPGAYQLIVKDLGNGCTAVRQVSVAENVVPPVAEAGPAKLLTCKQTIVSLDGAGSSLGSNFSYKWSGTAAILTGSTTLNPELGASGTFTLTVTDAANGCTSTDQVSVSEDKAPPAALIAPPATLTCSQKTVTLDGSGSGVGTNSTFVWTTPSGNILSGQNTLSPVVDEPGTYILSVENQSNGCVGTANAVVAQNIVAPVAEAGPSAILHCKQSSLTLAGSSPTPGSMTYAWTTLDGHFIGIPNVAGPLVDAPGTYRLVVTNPANGCTGEDATTVSEIPDPDFSVEISNPDCKNTVGTATASTVSGGLAPFSFSLGSTFQPENIFEKLKPDTYTMTVRDANGCTSEQTFVVEPPFAATLEIEDVEALDFGDSTRLNPITNIASGQVASWAWSPAATLSCPDCEHPWARPFSSETYRLTVTDLAGCTASAEVRVKVVRDRKVFIPNVFSPNEDGQNDAFVIFGKGIVSIRNLRVYDRWGNQLFDKQDLPPGDETAGWRGKFRDKTCNPGVYVWYAEIEFLDGEREFYSGDVTIVE